MSHFIVQSVKVVKLTDGNRDLYLLGYAGKDNNVSYYGPQRTSVEFYQPIMTDKVLEAISTLSQDVLGGGIQLKDKYSEPLSVQAEFFAKRLATSFKNAKTVKVDRIGDDKIEWGNGQNEIRMLYNKVMVSISKDITYKHGLYERDDNKGEHAEIVKILLDKEKTKEKIIPVLKHCKYLAAYLPIQFDIVNRFGAVVKKAKPEDKLTLDEVIEVAKYSGDWNNTVTVTENKISDKDVATKILNEDSDPARRFTIMHGMLDEKLLNDETFALNAGKNKVLLKFFTDKIKQNKEIAQVFVSNETRNIEYVSENLKDDYDFVINSIRGADKNISNIAQEISERLKDNEDIAKELLKETSYSFQHLSERLRDNPEICLLAAEKNKYSYQYFSQRLKELCSSEDPLPGLRKILIEKELSTNEPSTSRKSKI